jgi:hypothetical protein
VTSGGARWFAAPIAPGRVELRANRRGGAAARAIYRPMRFRSRLAAPINSVMMALGVGRATSEPLVHIEELRSLAGIPAARMASIRSSCGDRLVIGLADAGRLHAVVKVGPPHDEGLSNEAAALRALAGAADADAPFTVPRLRWSGLWRDRSVLITDAAPGRRAPRRVDEVVDLAVHLARGAGELGPIVHGDFTAWNVLTDGDATVVLDWERMTNGFDPLFDLAHFVTQLGSLARRFRPARAVAHLTAVGSPGWRYLEAVGVDPARAPALTATYLDRTLHFGGPTGAAYRRAMFAAL